MFLLLVLCSLFVLVQFSWSQNPDLLTGSVQTDTLQFVLFVLLPQSRLVKLILVRIQELTRILSGPSSSGASLWIHVFKQINVTCIF